MDGWERFKVASAIALPVVTLASGFWLADLVMSPSYPERRGYAIEGVPPVDLAGAQRAWPGGEGKPGSKDMLLGYVRNIAYAKVPAPQGGEAAGPAAVTDLGTLLASADPARGARSAQVCNSCHTFDAGGPNRTGPNLHGVVGRPLGSHGGFAYSAALSGAGGTWTYEALDRFLASPSRAVSGTKMSFAGLRNPRDRAQILAYLASVTPNAPPFPAPQPPPASTAAAP